MITRPRAGVQFRFWMGQRLPEDALPWAREQIDSPLWALRMVAVQMLFAAPLVLVAILVASARSSATSWTLFIMPIFLPLAYTARMLIRFDDEKQRHWNAITGSGRSRLGEVPSARYLVGLTITLIVAGVVLYLTIIR